MAIIYECDRCHKLNSSADDMREVQVSFKMLSSPSSNFALAGPNKHFCKDCLKNFSENFNKIITKVVNNG